MSFSLKQHLHLIHFNSNFWWCSYIYIYILYFVIQVKKNEIIGRYKPHDSFSGSKLYYFIYFYRRFYL